MLRLQRNIDESVLIEVPPSPTVQRIVVAVCDVRAEKVGLGFVAAREVKIIRTEIREREELESRRFKAVSVGVRQ